MSLMVKLAHEVAVAPNELANCTKFDEVLPTADGTYSIIRTVSQSAVIPEAFKQATMASTPQYGPVVLGNRRKSSSMTARLSSAPEHKAGAAGVAKKHITIKVNVQRVFP
jgi:hypothetical protein